MRALFVLIAFPSVLLNSHLNVSQLQLVCQTEFSAVGGKQLQEYVLVDHSPRREPQAVVDDVGPKEFQEVWHIREGVDFPARNMTNEPFLIVLSIVCEILNMLLNSYTNFTWQLVMYLD